MISPRYLDIHKCARCGQDHIQVRFDRFTIPIEDSDGTVWEWFGNCPNLDEPILMKDIKESETKA